MMKLHTLWLLHVLLIFVHSSVTSALPAAQYELTFQTDSTTDQSGSVTLKCRNGITLEDLNVQQVKFWLNATSSNAQDLREREDFGDVEVVGCCSIKFNLTRKLEGFYTCGEVSDNGALIESPAKELISLQTIISQTVSIQTNFSATSGDTAIIQCPVKPGALLQHYYVAWYKDNILIAELPGGNPTDSRYDINMSTFSLLINSSNINDTSASYQCEVYVQNPLSDTNTKINTEINDVTLTLEVTNDADVIIQLVTSESSTVSYQLIFQTDRTTERSGSVILKCRNDITLEEINVQQVKFWLNATSSNAQDLREREDFGGVEVIGCCRIKFNLTKKLEGFYTCGEISDDGARIESPSLELISLQKFIPETVTTQTMFFATSSDTAIIQCPIKPGALLQHYYVAWYKDDILIAELDNRLEEMGRMDSRFDIDRSTFSLLINSSNINDTSMKYLCEVYVQNPLSDTNTKINTEIDDILTLQVYDMPELLSKPSRFILTSTTELPSFTCTAIGFPSPSIVWTYTDSNDVEKLLTNGEEYEIVITGSTIKMENGQFLTHSTVTFLNRIAQGSKGLVKCRVRHYGGHSSWYFF